jgi:predicted dehydrogenase
MKALFVGLGSAGQRHMRNLERILGDKVAFSAYRMQGFDKVFDDDLSIVKGQTLQERFNLKEYSDFDAAIKEGVDAVFITNPNSMHMEYALRAARAGNNLFIEKPVSVSMDGADDLLDIVAKKRLVVYVGYQNRLHPCIKRLKQCMEAAELGDIVAVQSEIGELLTSMHRYQDYCTMIESNKALGGGVVKSQLHELDYLCYLFGLPDEVYAIGGKRSRLEIDVEDCVATLCRYRGANGEFAVSVHQDFLQSPPVRTCRVIGTLGRAEVDLLKNTFDMWGKEVEIHETYNDFSRNDMFLEEMRLFLNAIENRSGTFVSLKDGLESLRFALCILESLDSKHPVHMQQY